MNITLGYAREVLARFADNGYCSDDQRVADCINSAVQKLMIKAPADASIVRMRFCVTNGIITLPREVHHIIKANNCEYPMQVNNRWYEFLNGGPGSMDFSSTSVIDLADMGDGFRTHTDIITPRSIMVTCDLEEEDGTEILLRGNDENGKEVITYLYEDEDPTVVTGSYAGERITIGYDTPFYSNHKFSAITSVVKPVTKGYVYLSSYDPDDTESIFQIASYHPAEESPSYRRYFVTGGSTQYNTIIAMAKLRYLPATHDSDTLLVQNIPALEAMMKSTNLYNAYDFENGEKFEAMAVRYYTEQIESENMGTTHIDFILGFAPGDVQGVM
jgi:hypothetical protein